MKLDKMYKLSEEENERLRAQFKCQEDDREYLIRQVRVCYGSTPDADECSIEVF